MEKSIIPRDIDLSDYMVRESEHVRKVYDDRINQTRALEKYSLLATGAIWSWCATNLDSPAVHILIWNPSYLISLISN